MVLKSLVPNNFFFAIVKDSYLVLILYIILIDVSFKHPGIRIDTNFSLAQKVKKYIYRVFKFLMMVLRS